MSRIKILLKGLAIFLVAVTVVSLALLAMFGSRQALATDLFTKTIWWGKSLATQGSCGIWGGTANIPSQCWRNTYFNDGEYALHWLGSKSFYCPGYVRIYMKIKIPELQEKYDDWAWTFGITGADNHWGSDNVLYLDIYDTVPGHPQYLEGSKIIPGHKTFDRAAVGALRLDSEYSEAYAYQWWLKATCNDSAIPTNTPRATPGPTGIP